VDLTSVVQQMRLDELALEASSCLQLAGVPHVLLKGPTTARWLYSPPRPYVDVDLLLPLTAVPSAVHVLEAAGIASASAGRVGETASHSLLMHTPGGLELDLHVTLPMLPPAYGGQDRDRVWLVLADHHEPFLLEGRPVPALDAPGRCLVLALHALGNGFRGAQSLEDLRRSRTLADRDTWSAAEDLAARLGVLPLLQAGITLVEPGPLPAGLPPDVRMRLEGHGAYIFQLERLANAPRRELPRLVLRELCPSPGFMRHDDPARTQTSTALLLAYLRRWRTLSGELPGAWRRWRQLRRL